MFEIARDRHDRVANDKRRKRRNERNAANVGWYDISVGGGVNSKRLLPVFRDQWESGSRSISKQVRITCTTCTSALLARPCVKSSFFYIAAQKNSRSAWREAVWLGNSGNRGKLNQCIRTLANYPAIPYSEKRRPDGRDFYFHVLLRRFISTPLLEKDTTDRIIYN